jgi:hypothetical protein
MKKYLRIAILVLMVLAGTAMLAWYFFIRRQVPSHAVCIPKNAVAVLTLNMRELALDLSGKKNPLPGEIGSLLRTADQHGGSGLKESADVLVFLFSQGEDAWFGVSLKIADHKRFSDFIISQVGKNFKLNPVEGTSIVQFDTSSATLGWNTEFALFLYPFGNSDATSTARACDKLLAQQEENSVLANEDFRKHELNAFDAGIWLQAKEFLKFTKGGKLFRTYLATTEYVSVSIDFRAGETYMRALVTNSGEARPMGENKSKIPVDPDQVAGIIRSGFPAENDSLFSARMASPPFDVLPFSEEELHQLVPFMNGSSVFLLHDTISYEMDYIAYEYDTAYNRYPVKTRRKIKTRAKTFSFGLNDSQKAETLIRGWMQTDSIPFVNGSWSFSQNGAPDRLFVLDDMLTWTNWHGTDGKQHSADTRWDGYSVYLNSGELLFDPGEISAGIFSGFSAMLNGLAKKTGLFTISQPVVNGKISSFEVRVWMTNEEINALLQLLDLFPAPK